MRNNCELIGFWLKEIGQEDSAEMMAVRLLVFFVDPDVASICNVDINKLVFDESEDKKGL